MDCKLTYKLLIRREASNGYIFKMHNVLRTYSTYNYLYVGYFTQLYFNTNEVILITLKVHRQILERVIFEANNRFIKECNF